MDPNTPGRIYTIHLEHPLGDDGNGGRSKCQHYTGWTSRNVAARINEHRRRRVDDGREEQGGQVLAHANTRGIPWRVVLVQPGTLADERRLKANGHHARRCPECNPTRDNRRTMHESEHRYTGAGAVGITARTVYTFHCGTCPDTVETVAENVREAREHAEAGGWRNGYRRDYAATYRGAEPVASSWRCPDCRHV